MTITPIKVIIELDPEQTTPEQISIELFADSPGAPRFRLTSYAGPRVGPGSIWVRSHVTGESPADHVVSEQDVLDVVNRILVTERRAEWTWARFVDELALQISPGELVREFEVEADVILSGELRSALRSPGKRLAAGQPVVSRISITGP